MFHKTRIKLTILNSLVFILLIGILGSIIYAFVRQNLYSDVDRSLLLSIEHNEGPIPGLEVPPRDPRITVLVWTKDNKIIDPPHAPPQMDFFKQHESLLIPKSFQTLQDIKIDNFYFRTDTILIEFQGQPVKLQFIRNINAEKSTLSMLLIIMAAGCGIGSIFAIIAGFFLAERALRPIKKAWDKQQQFVSDASHELRTPLAVIQSRTELLLQTPSAKIEEKIVHISTIFGECRRLSKLVGNLLTLARSDSNEVEIEKKEFSLDKLLAEIAEHYSEVAAYQGKEICLLSGPRITLIGDKDRIHQLMVILLDNAMKYTSNEDGKITLSCYETKNHIGITVEDNGMGIKEADIPHIFNRFYQVDKSRKKSESLGLGLSIAAWIIEKHHGKVKVQSKLGEGTRFDILFSKRKLI
ncbi:sensor histidine kinase [Aneurinibacillus terranovensis]|uniref:sensor histidine kinase n=1 Tax=Aneurinibacillus terranovensis TaxID=278991 RepID=UPI000415D8EB|nr:HAMP domain-containing sensor histidine kinase [Aneurinibacillus terranovensis]